MNIVSIISVNYNQPKITVEFLKSVSQTTSNDQIEVILVDNGSLEDHGETFKSIYPGLKYIRSEENLGFAGGNNLGIRHASGDYLLFLNNDTELTPNMINVLINEFISNPDIGLLSPLIMYHENKDLIQYAGYSKMNYLTARNQNIGLLERNLNQFNVSQETGFVHGAAMMCRKRDLEHVGYMDENYFLYYEELDWCEKFKKAGKKIWFTGKTMIYHKESMSVGKQSSTKAYFMHRNRMLFIRKNTSLLNSFFFSLYYILFASPRTIFIHYRNERNDLIPWIVKAIFWNLKNAKDSKILGYKTP